MHAVTTAAESNDADSSSADSSNNVQTNGEAVEPAELIDTEASAESSEEASAEGENNSAKQRDGKSRRAPWRTQKHNTNRKSAPDTDADTAQ